MNFTKRLLTVGALLLALSLVPAPPVLAQSPNPAGLDGSFVAGSAGANYHYINLSQLSGDGFTRFQAKFISHFTISTADSCRVGFFSINDTSYDDPWNMKMPSEIGVADFTWNSATMDDNISRFILLNSSTEYEFNVNADVMVLLHYNTGTVDYEAIVEY